MAVRILCSFLLRSLPERRILKRGLCYGNVAGWMGGCKDKKGKASALDIAPLTILDSGALLLLL